MKWMFWKKEFWEENTLPQIDVKEKLEESEEWTLEEYENFVTLKMSDASMANFSSKLGTAGLGLAGEAGETADLVKKLLFHGMTFNEEIREKFIKELGDIMFYVTFAARHVCNTSVQDVIQKNVQKLTLRYKDGFTIEEFMKKENQKVD